MHYASPQSPLTSRHQNRNRTTDGHKGPTQPPLFPRPYYTSVPPLPAYSRGGGSVDGGGGPGRPSSSTKNGHSHVNGIALRGFQRKILFRDRLQCLFRDKFRLSLCRRSI